MVDENNQSFKLLIMILLTIFYVSNMHFALYFAMHLTNSLHKMFTAVFSGFLTSMAIKNCEDSRVILKR